MPAPKKPATTPSLPGAQSTRTDGGIADKQVIRQLTGWSPSDTDTNASFAQTEASAPMAKTSGAKAMTPSQIESAANAETQQPENAPQTQDINLFKDMTGTPPSMDSTISPVMQPAAPDPVETLARALYAANPTENLRRVLAQFDKAMG